jgi:PAS domain S-box-containing protein
MNPNSFISLIQNTALLLAMGLLFDLVVIRKRQNYSKLWQIPSGMLLGGIGIALMLTPWVFAPGIIFDTRSVLLGISGLFFGSIPTLIAMTVTAAFRIYQGGAATWVGVSVILATGTLGILWRYLRRKPIIDFPLGELYLFGVLSHLVMLLCMLLLPRETALQVLENISLPVITIYPLGTVLLGLLMINRLKRERINDELRENEEKLRSIAVDLKNSEEQYRILTENIKDVVWILDTETMYFTYISPSVERLRGYTVEEIIHEPVDFSLTNEASEYLKSLIRSRVAAFLTGEVSPDHFYADDVEQPCKDGTTVWTEAVTVYYRNSQNDHVAVRGVTRDISHRKKLEERLIQREEYFSQLFEKAPLGYQSLDINGYLVDVNQAWLDQLGYTRNEVIGRSFGDFLIPEQVKLFNERFPLFKATGEAHVVFDMLRQNNSSINTLIDGRVRYDEQGNFLQTQCILTDLTERRRAEEQLSSVNNQLEKMLETSNKSRIVLLSLLEDQKKVEEEIQRLNLELEQRVLDRTVQLNAANQELEAFSYSVSHDLRAPLRALDGFSSALIADYTNQLDEQGKHYLTRIKEAANRMGQLIEDLLNLSKVTRRDFNQESVDLSKMVHSICKELQVINTDRKIELKIQDDISVMADSHLIKIALENLFQNAFKFTGKQDQAIIRFGMKKIDNEKVYFVSDNGVGFNMEYAGKLFSPFQRLHGMNEFPGTGIGLVTVHRIITRHGGRIWPEAKENQGVTFYFTIGGINE